MHYLWLVENRKGQALVEYALLVALVAACLVAILGLTRNAATGAYARTTVKIAPVGSAGLGRGSGSAGASWRPVAHSEDAGPAASPDSSGSGEPADPSIPPGIAPDR
jgi:Flp pilus assembly pilin Flp